MKKRIIATAISLVMVIASILSLTMSAYADTGDTQNQNSSTGSNVSDLQNLDSVKPEGYDETDTSNPYGAKDGSNMLLAAQNELMLYVTKGDKQNGSVYVKDGLGLENAGINSGENAYRKDDKGNVTSIAYNHDLNNELTYNNNSYVSGTLSDSFVKAVAFDATGTGRKDHVATLSLWCPSKNNAHVILSVRNNTGSTTFASTHVDLGEANWLYNMAQAKMGNYFSITAGDYNGDGIDSIAVSVPLDSSFSVQVFSYDSSNSQIVKKDTLGSGDLSFAGYTTEDDEDLKLTCSLATGDLNKDDLDELAVCIGTNTRSAEVNTSDIRYNSALLSVWCNRSSSDNDLEKKSQQSLYCNKDGNSYDVLPSAAVTAGDVDKDGYDEIVTAGYLDSNAVYDTTTNKYKNMYEFDKTNFGLATFNMDTGELNSTSIEEVKMTPVLSGGLHFDYSNSDDVNVMPAVACAAMNGQASQEFVFVSAGVYDLSGSTASLSYDLDGYSSYSGEKSDRYFVDSVTSGVFDNNDAGCEQFVFSLGHKVSGDNRYDFTLAAIGRTSYQNSTVFYSSYYCAGTGEFDSTAYFPVKKANDDTPAGVSGLNYVPVAVDVDNDGQMVRLSGKGYNYSDPQLITVLQAAPYFEELGGSENYDNNETSYKIETSYTFGNSHGDSVSFSVSVGTTVSGGGNGVSVSAGYNYDWDKTYENSLTTSYSTTFTASTYDTAVIQRTPFTVYYYEIWDTANNVGTKTYVCVSVPMKPALYLLSTDDYNQYAASYNSTMINNQEKYGSGLNGRLATIDGSVLPKNIDASTNERESSEGHPENYYQNWASAGYGQKILSSGTYALSHNGGATTSTFTSSSEDTKTITSSHGFNFGLSITTGIEFKSFKLEDTYETHLEYKRSTGHFETKGNLTEASGKVSNIDSSLLQGNGYDADSVSRFGFTWQFGMWKRKLQTDNSGTVLDIPVYGYVVWGVTKPCNPVTDLTAEIDNDIHDNVNLKWIEPAADENQTDTLIGYIVYRKAYDQDDAVVLTPEPVTDTSYTDSGITPKGMIYTYYVKAKYQHTEGENITSYLSIPSNKSSAVICDSGQDAREIELRTTEDKAYIQWRYVGDGDDKWTNLVALSDITGLQGEKGETGSDGTDGKDGTDGTNGKDGADGTDGKDGTNGREIELQTTDTAIQWRYTGDTKWQDLMPLSELKGADGSDGSNGTDGTDGSEVELRSTDTELQWRYSDEETWYSLVKLSAFQGVGSGEFRSENGYIQWKPSGSSTWQNILPLTSLKGDTGKDGTDGKDGTNGTNGKDGTNGTNGKNGKDGVTTVVTVANESGSSNASNSAVRSYSSSGSNSANASTGQGASNSTNTTGGTNSTNSEATAENNSGTVNSSGTSNEDTLSERVIGRSGENSSQVVLDEGSSSGSAAGQGITAVKINEDGELLLTMADGTVMNAGSVREDSSGSKTAWTISIIALILALISLAANGFLLAGEIIRKKKTG